MKKYRLEALLISNHKLTNYDDLIGEFKSKVVPHERRYKYCDHYYLLRYFV